MDKENKPTSDVGTSYEYPSLIFTKEAMRVISRQLRDPKHGRTISILSIDGELVDALTLSGGAAKETGDPSTENVILPALMWSTASHLKRENRRRGAESRPLERCSIQPCGRFVLRDKTTRELLPRLTQENLDMAENLFQQSRKELEDSEAWTLISGLLSTKVPSKIEKIIAFACGSFSHSEEKHQSLSQRSAAQHALLLLIKKHLQSLDRSVQDVKCYSQDPVYTSIDKHVLHQHDIQVLQDPDGFLEVDESAMVLSFAPDVPVRAIVLDVARPAVLIWDTVTVSEEPASENESWADPVTERMHKLVSAEYSEHTIPDDDNLWNVSVYIRK